MSLLIKNGTIIDGTGKARYAADVLVENGTITEIGTLPPDAAADKFQEIVLLACHLRMQEADLVLLPAR